MYVRPVERRTEVHRIAPGHRGIEETVDHMRRMSREALHHPRVRELARALTARAGTPAEAAESIRAFLDERVRFIHDPPGVELIRTPRYILAQIEDDGVAAGDCDDVAVVAAALGMAAGLRARYVLIGLTPSDPYEHVFTELWTGSRWVELDTTRPAQMPGGIRVKRIGYRET